MPTRGTPQHNVRVSAELWSKARDKARRNGTDISTLVRAWLTVYTQRD